MFWRYSSIKSLKHKIRILSLLFIKEIRKIGPTLLKLLDLFLVKGITYSPFGSKRNNGLIGLFSWIRSNASPINSAQEIIFKVAGWRSAVV